MKFDELTPFQQEMLGDAVERQHVAWLRIAVATPIVFGISALAIWFFVFHLDAPFGSSMAGAVVLLLGIIWLAMLARTVTDKSVQDAIGSFGLTAAQRNEVLASMKTSGQYAQARTRAGKAVRAELDKGMEQGVKRATRRW
ncbi:MAG TPA: hypothetical protein VH083_25080 [Myxococcales bacterium]|jgi:uncharacterized membrane protein YidH (DUF202 family)|nr:hypothetical protein [Myxococcales bacterium]